MDNYRVFEELTKRFGDEVFTTRQALQYLGLSRARLYDLIKAENIRPVALYRKQNVYMQSDIRRLAVARANN